MPEIISLVCSGWMGDICLGATIDIIWNKVRLVCAIYLWINRAINFSPAWFLLKRGGMLDYKIRRQVSQQFQISLYLATAEVFDIFIYNQPTLRLTNLQSLCK